MQNEFHNIHCMPYTRIDYRYNRFSRMCDLDRNAIDDG